MSWLHRFLNVFRPQRLDDELESELQYHLAETADRLRESGLSDKQAWQEARRRLGNYSTQKEKTRDMNLAAWPDQMRADIIYGLRQLRLNPGFAAVAIISLSLGIGANTAIFQLVNAIRLRMLPVSNPQDLVSIDFEPGSTRAGFWPTHGATMTYPEWEQIRNRQHAFTSVLAWSATRFNLATGGEPRFAEGLYVSGNFFRELGIGSVIGRTLTSADDSSTCDAAAVLSYSFWQRELGGNPAAVGRTVNLDGHAIPVIGVTPPSFFGVQVGTRYDVAIPLCADRFMVGSNPSRIPLRYAWWLAAMGRLKPGWTIQRANTDLHAISPAVMQATLPESYRPDVAKSYLANKLTAAPGGTGVSLLRQQYERPLWLLLATAGLVLLIACANLANLLLARAAAREQEIAVRLAIGASRGRIVCQLLAESLLIATAGAALGAALAMLLSRGLIAYISSSDNPLFVDLTLDWRMLGFTAALAVLTCLLFGLMPALRATGLAPGSAMRASGRSVTAGRERFSLRRALVTAQVALSLTLLFAALLFVRSLHNLLTVDTGFQPDRILSVNIDFEKARYASDERLRVYRELSERLAALPGVASAAQVSFTPMAGGTWDNLVAPDGESAATRGKQSFFNVTGPGYFHTMGTPLLAGREFSRHDTSATPKVAIVNRMFAHKFFGGANPVGRTFHMAADAGKPESVFQIVGLVRDTKYAELREEDKPIAFFPIAQQDDPPARATFVLRLNGPVGMVIESARAAIGTMSSAMGIEFKPLSRQLKDSLLREELMATLSGGFAFLAGLLATLGLYGVIAYMVARRRNEIGVRMALGANRSSVIGLVLREALLLLGFGLTAGIAVSLFAGKLAATLLFGLQPRDTISLIVSSAALTLVALLASYIPARRAAGVDPITTLRNE